MAPDAVVGLDAETFKAAMEPLYFMLGVISGLLVMNLFKGRWFV